MPLLVGLAACSDDDGQSAQERYCEAGEALESSVTALVELDLVAEGTNGVESAVEEVSSLPRKARQKVVDRSVQAANSVKSYIVFPPAVR